MEHFRFPCHLNLINKLLHIMHNIIYTERNDLLMSIDANGVVTNGMLARYDAGIKDIIAMRTAEKNPVRYKVVKSTSTGSQTYSFYKKDENDKKSVQTRQRKIRNA